MIAGPKLKEHFVEGSRTHSSQKGWCFERSRRWLANTASPNLKKAFEDHIVETQRHIERLLRIFDDMAWPDQIDNPVHGETCDAIVEAVENSRRAIENPMGPEPLDGAFAASAQAVERYEVARYGSLESWARELGLTFAAQLLRDTLEEEMRAEKLFGRFVADGLGNGVSQAA